MLTDIKLAPLLPDVNNNFGSSLILDFRISWRHVQAKNSRERPDTNVLIGLYREHNIIERHPTGSESISIDGKFFSVGLVILSSSLEYWPENRALSVEGHRWSLSASFSQVLYFAASPLESLQLRDRWPRTGIQGTPRTCCRRTSWPGALKIFRFVECPTTFQCLP